MLIMKQTTNNRKQAANTGTADYYAKKLNSTKKMAVSFRIGSRVIVLVKNGSFWDMSNGNGTGTQYDMTTQEAADVLALDYQDAQREAVTLETISRDRYGIDRTADGLEFRAVVVENETGEELAAFLNIEDAHAAGWYGYRLEADEDAHDNEGSRGARLLFQCCREEDAGTSRIAYGNSYEQAAANYRAGRFGLTCTRAAEDIEKSGKENRYIVRGENTLGYITGTQKPGQTPVCFVVMAVNVEAGGDPTLIDRETIATDYRPATKEDEDVFKVRIF